MKKPTVRREPALVAALSLIILLFACDQTQAHDGPHVNGVVHARTKASESRKNPRPSRSDTSGVKRPIRPRWGKNWFPNTKLVNQDGTVVRFYDDLIANKVVVINFVFTSCSNSCPLETAKLKQVYEILGPQMGKEVFFVSVSIDPAKDSSTVLKSYMKNYQIGPGWDFLTGDKEAINELRMKLGLLNPNDGEESLEDHNLNFLVGNEATGQWMRRSPMDNPKLLAGLIRDDLQAYKVARNPATSYADVPKVEARAVGESIFHTRCASCHSIGGGRSLGPDLLGVTLRRDPSWLHNWIKQPDVVLAANDPLARALFREYDEVIMPNLKLSDAEVSAVIGFIEAESTKKAQPKN